MNFIKTFFKIHWVGMIISIFIGMVVVAPPIVWRMSSDYKGVGMFKTNTETLYLAQVQEVYDGHGGLGNSYFADLKNSPYLFPPLSAHIIAGFGKLFGLNAVDAAIAMRFLAPALISFFIYLFSFYLTGRRIIGLVAAPFIILGYSLMNPRSILDLFNQNNWSQEKMFIDYGRPLTPQISVLFFYGYLLFFWKYLSDQKNKIYGIISAIILGTSFYVYFYTWTYLFALNGFVFLFYILRKNFDFAKKVLFVSVAGFIIGIPYLMHSFEAMKNTLYAEIGPRFGFVSARKFYFSKTVFGALLIFLASYKLLSKEVREFYIPFFITAFFTVNQHIITGMYFRFDNHHHWYYSKPLLMILFSVILFSLLDKFKIKKMYTWIIAGFMISMFFYDGILVQKVSYEAVLPEVKAEQRYAELFTWLNNSTKKDTTVLSSMEISKLTPAVTHNNVYYHGGALYALAPNGRFLDIYLAYTYLHKVSRDEIHQYLEEKREEISGFVFGYTYLVQEGKCFECFPQSVLDEMEKKYKELSDENFLNFLKKYPADYIVWDKKTNPEWNLERFNLKQVVNFGDIYVYDLRDISI